METIRIELCVMDIFSAAAWHERDVFVCSHQILCFPLPKALQF